MKIRIEHMHPYIIPENSVEVELVREYRGFKDEKLKVLKGKPNKVSRQGFCHLFIAMGQQGDIEVVLPKTEK